MKRIQINEPGACRGSVICKLGWSPEYENQTPEILLMHICLALIILELNFIKE